MLQNIIIFCLIFWGLTSAANYFYKIKGRPTKNQFYECGFKAISDLQLQINLNFAIVCVFLILYDVEFIFIYPAAFNILTVSFAQVWVLFLFLFLVIASLYYDWCMNAINWQY